MKNKVLNNLCNVILIFIWPTLLMCNEVYLSNKVSMDTQLNKVNISIEKHSLDSAIIRQSDLNLKKYIMASRKQIVLEMLKMRMELRFLKTTLYQTYQKFSSVQEKKKLNTLFERTKFPTMYTDLGRYSKLIQQLHQKDNNDENWPKELMEKSLALVNNDIETNLWKYSTFSNESYKLKNTRPSNEVRQRQLEVLNAKRLDILTSENDRFLVLPIFHNLTIKRKTEFFFFHKKTNYYFYQLIVAHMLENNQLNKFIGKINKKKKRQRARKVKMTAVELATNLNIFSWDDIDQNDKSFKVTLDALPVLKNDLNRLGEINFKKNTLSVMKALMARLLDKEIQYIDEGLNLFNKENDLLKHYSFLHLLISLPGDISNKYYPKYDIFNPFQIGLYKEQLETNAILDEIDRSESKLSNLLYGLGFVSMFIPYGQVISPLLFATGASHNIVNNKLPNYIMQSMRKKFFEAAYNPFEVGEKETSQITYNELLAQNILDQNAKSQLTTALFIEAPLLLISSLYKIKKTIKMFPGSNILKLGKLWKHRYKKWAVGMFKNLPANISKGQKAPLSFMTKEIIKSIVTNSNVQVASFYFAGLFSMQAVFDYYNFGYDKNKENLTPSDINNAIDVKNSKEYVQQYEFAILQDLKLVSNIFKKNDYKHKINHLKEMYKAPQALSKTSWFNLHDGENTIKIFNTVYFPLKAYLALLNETSDKRAHIMANKIAKKHLFQKQIQSDTLKALLQVNLTDFTKHFLNSSNPETDAKVGYFGRNMTYFYNQNLSLNMPMTMTLDELDVLSTYWASIYDYMGEGDE